ncbi:hypothetical protein B0H19DRAFT_1260993 [Mycena capillaripes]|nr:hypothetical protein B0H19DRAFT_1260993 [Mycena capillaripes]
MKLHPEQGQPSTSWANADPLGCQVSGLLAFSAADPRECLSSGRTLDYASRIFLTTPDPLYSNRSNVLLRITADTPHRGCFSNFVEALAPWGIEEDAIPIAFNCFMNVVVDGETGALRVDPPKSKAGDYVGFVAEVDLVVALTACSALQSNGGSFKPIRWKVDDAPQV